MLCEWAEELTHLLGRAGGDEVAADGRPVALAKLGEAQQEQAMLLLGPRNALALLLVCAALRSLACGVVRCGGL